MNDYTALLENGRWAMGFMLIIATAFALFMTIIVAVVCALLNIIFQKIRRTKWYAAIWYRVFETERVFNLEQRKFVNHKELRAWDIPISSKMGSFITASEDIDGIADYEYYEFKHGAIILVCDVWGNRILQAQKKDLKRHETLIEHLLNKRAVQENEWEQGYNASFYKELDVSQGYDLVGECDECGECLYPADEIATHPSIYECPSCGHPNKRGS